MGFFTGHIDYLVGLWRENPADGLDYLNFAYQYCIGYPVFRVFEIVGGGTMRGNKNGKNPASVGNGQQWTQFVTISLAGHTKDEIDGYFTGDVALADAIDRLVRDGYRIGLSYDAERDATIASCTCKDADSVNSGKTFTAFAQTWYEALEVMCFKHYVVADAVWPSPDNRFTGATFG